MEEYMFGCFFEEEIYQVWCVLNNFENLNSTTSFDRQDREMNFYQKKRLSVLIGYS